MCGIAGLLGREEPGLVGRMCDRIAHRGPDGHAVWSDEGVTLGHRRLSIIDIATGDQPMESHDGRFCVVYNGEIYNHAELRLELEAAGHTFHTDHADTEVLLEGYRAWGPAVVQRLEGMFAFALWDSQRRELFVARDPFGIKPFFWASVDGDLLFASEQKALFADDRLARTPDLDRLKERATMEFLTGQATLFEHVHQLPPGSWALLRPGDQEIAWQPYYQVPSETFADPVAAARAIRDRLVHSVEEQLMSDVPLGVVLSGGLDSAAVAAIHQTMFSDAPIHTFTVAESEAVQDVQFSRRLAEHLGTDHHETFFDLDEVMQGLPFYTWHNENINYTEFFFQPLFRELRKTATVALCGQGADELWGGYQRYRDPQALATERLRRIRAARPAHAERLCTEVAFTHSSASALAEYDQLGGQLNNFQLRLVDRNSMAHSVEVRVPFLSRPLHQASRATPWGWKLHEGIEKWVLRKAVEDIGLPKEFVWRPKVPAGRATAPTVMQAFEAEAAKLVTKRAMADHPLAGSFRLPAEQLVYDLWHEIFVERDGIQGLALEDLA